MSRKYEKNRFFRSKIDHFTQKSKNHFFSRKTGPLAPKSKITAFIIDTGPIRGNSEKYKASNCSSRLLNFCLLCSNLRQFHPLIGSTFTHSLTLKISDHRFTIKWKSALEQIVKFFWNLLSRKLLYFSFLCTCCLDVSLFKWRFSYLTMKIALRTLK